jgi:hypothetical protein
VLRDAGRADDLGDAPALTAVHAVAVAALLRNLAAPDLLRTARNGMARAWCSRPSITYGRV